MEPMTIEQIQEYLPHRHPFLLLDRIVEWEKDKRLVALKNVTMNEPFFPGHFPNYAVMPGVLIVEAMAQGCAMLGMLSMGQKNDGRSVYLFAGIDEARFKRPVRPGDQLRIEVEQLRVARGVGKFRTVARVDGEVASEAVLLCILRAVA
jgi:3-hydroxyacyl-[acyl-carrier-protein] dehydratase